MNDTHRLALMNGLMAYGMGWMASRLVERFAREPGLADQLEQMRAEVERQLKDAVPEGWSIEEKADAIEQATREFNKNVEQWIAAVRNA